METVNCIVCSSDQYHTLYILEDYLLRNNEGKTTLIKCNNCGLVYQNPRPTELEMSKNYPPEYDSYQTIASQKKTSLIGHKFSGLGQSNRWKYVIRFKNRGNLLDIGCATGNFLYPKRHSVEWNLIGIDNNPDAVDIAKGLGINVLLSSLDRADFQPKEFDVITLWDVLEHLHNPITSLKEIHKLLKDDGILIIRTPNLDGWDYKLFRKYWFGFDAPRHLYIFDTSSLTKILDLVGFEIIDVNPLIGISSSFPLDIRFLLADKRMHPNNYERFMRIVNTPIFQLLIYPVALFGSMLFGSSFLTITAKKKDLIYVRDKT